MIVKEIMEKDVETIKSTATALDAAKKLARLGIGCLVVTRNGPNGQVPVGIVTDTDLICIVANEKDLTEVTVSDFMSSPVETIHSLDKVEKAGSRMRELGIEKLPVIYMDRLVGIVTTKDLSEHVPDIAAEVHSLVRAQKKSTDLR